MSGYGKKVIAALGLIALALFSLKLGQFAGGRFGQFTGAFGIGGALSLIVSLWPLGLIGAVVVFGSQVIERLERIEQALTERKEEVATYGS